MQIVTVGYGKLTSTNEESHVTPNATNTTTVVRANTSTSLHYCDLQESCGDRNIAGADVEDRASRDVRSNMREPFRVRTATPLFRLQRMRILHRSNAFDVERDVPAWKWTLLTRVLRPIA